MKKIIALLSLLSLTTCTTPEKVAEAPAPAPETREPAAAPYAGKTTTIYGLQVPLHNLEKVPADETAAIASLNEIMMGLFKNEYGSKGVTVDKASGLEVKGTRRGVHPRSHGCVTGTLNVNSNLKTEAGLFKRGAIYPVTARFSNGSPKATANDADIDTRGFAMKVFNVPGKNIFAQQLSLGDEVTQDFTLNSTEPFFADNAFRYSQFMKILTFEAPTLKKAGGMFVKKLALDGHPIIAARVVNAFLKIQNHKATTPLGIPYFSITAFQYGEGPDAPIVKFKMEPCRGKFDDPVKAGDPYFLRNNLKTRMEKEGACFKFMVQQRVRKHWTLEDPTNSWPERVAPFTEIARVQFPAQSPMAENTCEKIVINPWNTLAAHKPVGGINRIRLPTYLLSVESRRKTNGY